MLVAISSSVAGSADADPLTFWGYAVTTSIVLPLAARWGFVERTRWISVVLLVAALTVALLQLRMLQAWGCARSGTGRGRSAA